MLGSRGPVRLAGVLLVAMVVYFTRQAFLARAHPWGQPLAAAAIWKLPQRLSPVGETAATFPVVDAVGNDVYVAWCGKMTGSTDPFYRHSTDGGDTWPSSATTISSSTSTSSGVLDMAVDGDLGLHFAWREHLGGDDYQLYYNYNAITTTLIAESGQELLPAIAVTSDTVHVVWTDLTGAGSIYYRNKPISGDSWSSATLVAVGNLSLKDPDVAPDDGGNLYLVWSQVHPVSSTVYLRKRTASGNWLTPRGLITPSSSITTQNEHPSVAIDGQNVYVVWGEKIGQGTQADKYITFAKSEDEGTGWTAQQRILGPVHTQEPLFIGNPRVAVDSLGSVRLVAHWTPAAYNADEVFYSYSDDGGESWWPSPLPSERSLSNVSRTEADASQTPSLMVSGERAHVAWSETGSNFVYYTYGNPVAGSVYLPVIFKNY